MEEETNEQPPKEKGKPKLLPLILIALVCLLAGGGAGVLVLGPKLLASGGEASDAAQAEENQPEPDELPPAPEGQPDTRTMYVLDNLILNPAFTNGMRFLMMSVAFEVRSQEVADQLKARDPEVRDVVLRVSGARTIEELASTTGRDSLKLELRDSVRTLVPRGSVGRVYFPQFVIQ